VNEGRGEPQEKKDGFWPVGFCRRIGRGAASAPAERNSEHSGNFNFGKGLKPQKKNREVEIEEETGQQEKKNQEAFVRIGAAVALKKGGRARHITSPKYK